MDVVYSSKPITSMLVKNVGMYLLGIKNPHASRYEKIACYK